MVRQVADHHGPSAEALTQSREVESGRVGLEQFHPGIGRELASEHPGQIPVALHGHHPTSLPGEHGGQGAQSSPQLDHHVIRAQLGGFDDPGQHVQIHQEVLTPGLLGAQAVLAQQGFHVQLLGHESPASTSKSRL